MSVRLNGTATVPASLQTDITTIKNNVATILGRVPATVALDADMQTLLARLTATRAGYLDNLLGLTALRTGYLDNLSGGAVALASSITSLALQSTTSENGTDSTDTAITVRQLVASSASAIRRISFSGVANWAGAGTGTIDVYILTGAGGSEVTRAIASVYSTTLLQQGFFVTVQVNLAIGTRVAWKFLGSVAPIVNIGYTIEEA